MATRAKDLTGQRFGDLVVVERAGSTKNGKARWLCRCDCGNTTRSESTDLRVGRTRTCGCGARRATNRRHAAARGDLVGQRFGRLAVVAFAGLNSYPRATWLCQCDCGTSTVVADHHLKSGETVACGCKRDEVMAARPTHLIQDVVTYQQAHGRVKAIHGSASGHRCVDCEDWAMDWSYDHLDPDERHDERGRSYSMKPRHYAPRCRTCHKRFDLRAAKSHAITQEGATA